MVNICKHNKLTEKRKVQLSYVDFLCVLNNIVPSKSWFLHLFKVEMTILYRKADKSKPNIYLKYAFKLIFNQICGLVDVDKTIMKSKFFLYLDDYSIV